MGPCAKQTIRCQIITRHGVTFEGTNSCASPQAACPRLPGEGYEKCASICKQQGHAEIQALRGVGSLAIGARAILTGHYYVCEPCARALREAGVISFEVKFE